MDKLKQIESILTESINEIIALSNVKTELERELPFDNFENAREHYRGAQGRAKYLLTTLLKIMDIVGVYKE